VVVWCAQRSLTLPGDLRVQTVHDNVLLILSRGAQDTHAAQPGDDEPSLHEVLGVHNASVGLKSLR
jgi:hypothetical protein